MGVVAEALSFIVLLAGAVVQGADAASFTALQEESKNQQIVTFLPGVSPEQRRKTVEQAGGTVVKELPFVDGLLVSFPKKITPAGVTLKSAKGVESVEPNAYRKWIIVESVPLPSAQAALQSAAKSASAPGIGDASFKAQADSKVFVPWGVKRVGAPQAWDRATGAGVRVAIIDTGIDCSHPYLACAGGANILDPGASPADDHGHGTHVAGTIGARPVDGKGIVGVAPAASLYAVKVLDAEGGGSIATIIEGIAWVAENGMNVANMSLGGPGSDAMVKAVKKAVSAGVAIVAATGNDPEASVSAPASYSEVIAVSASTSQDGLADFATTGPEVDFIAPGKDVESTWPGGKAARLSGTSMASPHVAGLAALAYSLGARSPSQVRSALKAAAAPLSGLSAQQQGSGLIDASRLR
ncbi:MAG: S8 family peptidase [Elusimicrobiota bacterium]